MKKFIFLILLFSFLVPFSVYADTNTYTKNCTTGGTSDCLDSIDGDSLVNGDKAIVFTSEQVYFYYLNSSSGVAESDPDIIAPDTNPGAKRWELKTDYSEDSTISYYNGDLAAAVAAIGSEYRTLFIDSDLNDLTANLTIPQNIHIVWYAGHPLGGAYTLTANCRLSAGFYPLFESDLTVIGTPIIEYAVPQWFGAVGDDSTDDTDALLAWIDFIGSGYFETTIIGPGKGFLPNGKYRYNQELIIPASATIYGNSLKSVLVPTDSISSIAVSQKAGSVLRDLVIDGKLTAAKIGLSIGGDGNIVNDGITENVNVANFLGTGGYGLYVGFAIHWEFKNSRFIDNEINCHIEGPSIGTANNLIFNFCRFKSGDGTGLQLICCDTVDFISCDFELNDDYGIFINPGVKLVTNVTFRGGYCEANQYAKASGPTRNAAYQVVINANASDIKFIDFKFYGNTNEAKAIQNNSASEVTLDSCYVYEQAGQVVYQSVASGAIVNWPSAISDLYTIISVSADSNLRIIDSSNGTFTPSITFSTPGDVSVAYTTQAGYWFRNNNQIIVTFEASGVITHTTAGGSLQLSGIPAACVNKTDILFVGNLIYQGITKAGYYDINPRISQADSVINFIASASGSAASTVGSSDVPTGGTIVLQGTLIYDASL